MGRSKQTQIYNYGSKFCKQSTKKNSLLSKKYPYIYECVNSE